MFTTGPINFSPPLIIGGFTLGDLLDKPWSQVLSLPSPGPCLVFLSRKGFSFPTACRCSSNAANSRSRAFRQSFYSYLRKCPYEHALGENYTHEIDYYRHHLTTYQATGDAGSLERKNQQGIVSSLPEMKRLLVKYKGIFMGGHATLDDNRMSFGLYDTN